MISRWQAYTGMFLALTACDHLANIDVHQEGTTTVPKGTILTSLVGDMGFGSFLDMNLVDAEELRNQGVQPGDIDHVYLEDLSLTVNDPVDGDLSFLSTVKVFVESDGLPKLLIAEADSFPAGERSVSFAVTPDADLAPYVISEKMSLTTDVTGHQPDVDTKILAAFDLMVGVTAQGACNATKSGQ